MKDKDKWEVQRMIYEILGERGRLYIEGTLEKHLRDEHNLIPLDCPVCGKLVVGYKQGMSYSDMATTCMIEPMADYYDTNYVLCLDCKGKFTYSLLSKVWKAV